MTQNRFGTILQTITSGHMGKQECVGSASPQGHLVYWPGVLSSALLTIQNVIHFSNRSTHEMRWAVTYMLYLQSCGQGEVKTRSFLSRANTQYLFVLSVDLHRRGRESGRKGGRIDEEPRPEAHNKQEIQNQGRSLTSTTTSNVPHKRKRDRRLKLDK